MGLLRSVDDNVVRGVAERVGPMAVGETHQYGEYAYAAEEHGGAQDELGGG